MHAANYCTSSSLSAKGYHACFHHHMTELQADPDSQFQKIFTSQAHAWQTGLGASTGLFKAALSQERGSRTEKSRGNQLYCEFSRPEGKQTLGTALDMRDGPLCAPSTKNFFLQGKSTTIPHMGEQTNPQHKKQMKQINLTFKISCSCFKTAWTSSCKSHLNSSSYIVERQH